LQGIGTFAGFIRVTQFNEQTTEGLKKAITDLCTQAGDKLKSFIIDLRNNSTRRSPSPMPSWRRARSYRRAAAPPRKPSGSMRALLSQSAAAEGPGMWKCRTEPSRVTTARVGVPLRPPR
jgi:hypothetical protein